MRLFLGSYAVVEDYDTIVKDLSTCFDARWVAPRNLHLTWYFLGETEDARPVIERLQPLKMTPRLPLRIEGFGTFGKPEPKTLYLKTNEIVPTILHQKIAEMLQLDPQPSFKPHVTVGRVKKVLCDDARHLDFPWMRETVGEIEPEIYLIESRLTPDGPIYIPLEQF